MGILGLECLQAAVRRSLLAAPACGRGSHPSYRLKPRFLRRVGADIAGGENPAKQVLIELCRQVVSCEPSARSAELATGSLHHLANGQPCRETELSQGGRELLPGAKGTGIRRLTVACARTEWYAAWEAISPVVLTLY
ncbi:hypothetical protein IFM12275_23760 [Nocardia sputorum]|nr:hypothetical protein IFM12275_23760 [Nocardia sputorum]